MKSEKRHSGAAVVAVVLLIIVVMIIVAIARHFWADSANKHFDALIAVYIEEKSEYSPEDTQTLRNRLVESGMFMKIHRWSRDSFIKDMALYQDMIVTRDQRQMRREKSGGSVIDSVINL